VAPWIAFGTSTIKFLDSFNTFRLLHFQNVSLGLMVPLSPAVSPAEGSFVSLFLDKSSMAMLLLRNIPRGIDDSSFLQAMILAILLNVIKKRKL